MDLFYDLSSNSLTRIAGGGGPMRTVEKKRGDSEPLTLRFYRGSTLQEALTGTVLIRFGVKEDVDGELLALADTWDEDDGVYTSVLDLNTEELETALEGAANENLLPCLAELTVSTDNGATWVSSQTLDFRVRNDVNKEADGAPTSLPSPEDWLAANGVVHDPLITGLTGGGATKLDGVATLSLPVGTLHAVMVSSTFVSIYALLASTNLEDAPDYVRPDDYAGGTNEKVWTLREMRSMRVIATGYVQGQSVKVVTGGGSAEIKGENLTDARELQLPDRSGEMMVGANSYATLAAANAAVGAIGVVFWNIANSRYEVTTDVA